MSARTAVFALCLALALAACGGSGGDPVGSDSSRGPTYVLVSTAPDPLRAASNNGADAGTYPVVVSFDLLIQETGGTACNLTNQTLVASPDPGPVKVERDIPTTAVPANGTLRIPMRLFYTRSLPAGMTLGLGVSVIDIHGNVVSQTGFVTVR